MISPLDDTITAWLLSAEPCSKQEREEICEAVQSYHTYMDRLRQLFDELAEHGNGSP